MEIMKTKQFLLKPKKGERLGQTMQDLMEEELGCQLYLDELDNTITAKKILLGKKYAVKLKMPENGTEIQCPQCRLKTNPVFNNSLFRKRWVCTKCYYEMTSQEVDKAEISRRYRYQRDIENVLLSIREKLNNIDIPEDHDIKFEFTDSIPALPRKPSFISKTKTS